MWNLNATKNIIVTEHSLEEQTQSDLRKMKNLTLLNHYIENYIIMVWNSSKDKIDRN